MGLFDSFRNKDFLTIVGSHRSGTSIFTKLLIENGIFHGSDLNIHNESKSFLRINEKIMSNYGASWDTPEHVQLTEYDIGKLEEEMSKNQFNSYFKSNVNLFFKQINYLAWKDPRTSITLKFWKNYFPNLKIIHLRRNGIDVANSLFSRESNKRKDHPHFSQRCLDINEAFRIWETYEKSILKELEDDENNMHIYYENLLEEESKITTLKNVSEFLGIKISDKKSIIRNGQKKQTKSKLDPFLVANSVIMRKYFYL